jgi:hypothetical protein
MKCVICQTKNPRGPVRNTTGKRELISFHRLCGGSCGMDKPFSAYTQSEVMTLVEIVVTENDEFRRAAAARATLPLDIPS